MASGLSHGLDYCNSDALSAGMSLGMFVLHRTRRQDRTELDGEGMTRGGEQESRRAYSKAE